LTVKPKQNDMRSPIVIRDVFFISQYGYSDQFNDNCWKFVC
jgi:hypothetical protein